jgi:shikimate dehydrogenase
MHNAAFAALDLDWVYVAFPVPRGEAARAVEAARLLGVVGLSVTMPHKEDAAAACDELDADADALGAVNTITLATGKPVVGANTDGAGFLAALRDEHVEPIGRRVLVLGAGGAARAIARALGDAGAVVTVAARRVEAARHAAALAGGIGLAFDAADVTVFDVIVNAPPLGMRGEPPPIDAASLRVGQFVYDAVYTVETPLLRHARSQGIACAGGLNMLVHQGALAFECWTGREAPRDVMKRAAGG